MTDATPAAPALDTPAPHFIDAPEASEIMKSVWEKHHPAEEKSEPEFAENPLDETQSEKIARQKVEGDNLDRTLRDAYDRVERREQREQAAMMPRLNFAQDMPAAQRIDKAIEAVSEWQQLPPDQRKLRAGAAREIEGLVEAAEKFGISVKTGADLKAVKDLVKPTEEAKPLPEIEQAFAKMAPHTKTHAEATKHIAGWIDHIDRTGISGWRDVIGTYGISPAQMLSQSERALIASEFFGVPAGRLAEIAFGGQPPQQQPVQDDGDQMVTAAITNYTERTGAMLDEPTRTKMAELLTAGKIKADGLSMQEIIRAAHKEAMRYRRPRRDAFGKAVAA